ncbi:MAG: hypothetical protein OCC49_19365 [Fibrobacterales bacterium]
MLKYLFILILVILMTTQCAFYDDAIDEEQCVVNGETYNHGEAVPCNDSCNSCTCSNGQIGSTLIGCVESSSE